MRRALLTLTLAAALAAGCGQTASTHTASLPAATTQAPTPGPFPTAWPLPDQGLSPGAVLSTTDTSHICPHVDPALEAERPSTADKAANYAAYHLTYPQPPNVYEDDHAVPIELDGRPSANQAAINVRTGTPIPAGASPAANLWPERNDTPSPAMITKWHLSAGFVHNSKDILEDVLHSDVCSGKVSLNDAQVAIATDWRAAYERYVVAAPAG